MTYFFFVAAFLRISSIFCSIPNFGCLNGAGKVVDWWVIYKEEKGHRYVYLDSSMTNPLGLSYSQSIIHFNSPLYRTIRSANFPSLSIPKRRHKSTFGKRNNPTPLYPDTFYVSWNDQPKKGSSSISDAHAKGFMGIKYTSANIIESFFIQHSLPRFPKSPDTLFDTNSFYRAQHFFCTSMKDEFTGPVDKLHYIEPQNVQNTNFFKILMNYAAVIKVKSIEPSHPTLAVNFAKIFFVLNDSLNKSTQKLSSFLIQSTHYNKESINIHVIAKSPDNHVDIYDDVTSLLCIHHNDYSGITNHKSGHPQNDKTAMLMIAQSHTDPATLGINHKVLVDTPDFFAAVHILNSIFIHLPVEGSNVPHYQPSMYRDHSKWSVNVIYGSEGEFPASMCFYDLNRSNKQAKRGGGAFCLNSSFFKMTPGSVAIWNMFMSFGPKPTDMARFNNAPVNSIISLINPTSGSNCFSGNFDIMPPKLKSNCRKSSRPKRKPTIFNTVPRSSTVQASTLIDEIIDPNEPEWKKTLREGILSKVEMSYLKFSKAPIGANGQYKLNILHAPYVASNPRIFHTVPSPFRFENDGKPVESDDKVPSLVGLKISNYFHQYGPSKLNKLLNNSFKLNISSSKITDSPGKPMSHLGIFSSGVKNPGSELKRRFYENENEDTSTKRPRGQFYKSSLYSINDKNNNYNSENDLYSSDGLAERLLGFNSRNDSLSEDIDNYQSSELENEVEAVAENVENRNEEENGEEDIPHGEEDIPLEGEDYETEDEVESDEIEVEELEDESDIEDSEDDDYQGEFE